MAPFSGAGVNMAILDATELALALSQSEDRSTAVPSDEERMFVRAAEAAEAAEGAGRGLEFVSERCIDSVLERFQSMQSAADTQ
jgi:2-polyprenyl-6-methoxyphenol hydroxylase-like FAD-dependent oxidoreductase